MIDREFTIQALQDAVRIDSRNPGLEAGAPGEWELAGYVQSRLHECGFDANIQDLGQRRANVVAVRKGVKSGPALMLNVHLDTVGVEGMPDPFSGACHGGRLLGRGAQDIKGGVAALLGVAKALAEGKVQLYGDLILAFVADEEYASLGTTELLRRGVTADAAIVIEPSELDICVAHRGYGIFELRIRGRTAHGGCPELGIDANLRMGPVLVELERLQQAWRQQYRHPGLGAPSLHVPLIAGGRQLFMYSDHCSARVECRTVPGQTADGIMAELQALLRGLHEGMADFSAVASLEQWRDPYAIDPEHPLVQMVLACARKVRGEQPALISHPWWEDAALLGQAGIDTVIIGPRGGGLHTEAEWVDIESVLQLAEILYRCVLVYCGSDQHQESRQVDAG